MRNGLKIKKNAPVLFSQGSVFSVEKRSISGKCWSFGQVCVFRGSGDGFKYGREHYLFLSLSATPCLLSSGKEANISFTSWGSVMVF